MNASRKVLVVDDDPAVRKSIDRVLTGKGYAVITAENGEEALRKLNEEKYDLIYTDIRMPGMSGLEVAEQVKARKPWTPVVIITGYGTDAAQARAKAAGVSSFVHKPLSPEMIEDSARDALAAPVAQVLALPAAAGLALIAGQFVPVVLGPKWVGAIVPLRLLALYGGVRSIDTVTPQVLIYTGNSRQSMWYSVIAACVMPVLFVVGTRWGVGGVAAVWIVAYPLVVAPQYRLAFRVLEMPAGQYFKTLWPAVSSTAIMVLAVGIVLAALPQTLAPVIRLGAEVVVGVAVYAGMIAWRHRARALAFVSIVREHAL